MHTSFFTVYISGSLAPSYQSRGLQPPRHALPLVLVKTFPSKGCYTTARVLGDIIWNETYTSVI